MATKTLIQKADKVIEASLDVMLEGLREKSQDKDARLRISDANTSCNSAVNVKRLEYSEKQLVFRILTRFSLKQQKEELPKLLVEFQGAR